jgi:23S rRNA pseudouridine955/2504/2580 synthase
MCKIITHSSQDSVTIAAMFCCINQMRKLGSIFAAQPGRLNHRREFMSAVTWVTIDTEQAGQRIDNFLLTHLKGVPRSHVYRLVRKGEVRVNKKRIDADYRLQTGDIVRVPPVRVAPTPAAATPNRGVCDQLESRILWEDKGLLILDKPAGIAVHGGSGLSYGVIEALRAMRPTSKFLELVHRLDRETSGCLMIAKKRSVLTQLHTLLRQGGVEKVYLALTQGHWRPSKQRVNLPLKKNVLQSGERIVRVNTEEGKQAATEFALQRQFKHVSLVAARPLTGRTHQIRVHAAATGHPIVGDEKYGQDAFNKTMRRQGVKRLFLHAHSLRFVLPETGQQVAVTAELDALLQAALDKMS